MAFFVYMVSINYLIHLVIKRGRYFMNTIRRKNQRGGADMLSVTLQVPEVAKMLGVSRAMAYQIVKTKGFPKIIIGERRIVIPREAFLRWLEEQTLN